MLCLTQNGGRHCTHVEMDTLAPAWNDVLLTHVGAAALMGGVLAEYVDKDVSIDDPICAPTNVTFSASDFTKGRVEFSCGTIGTFAVGVVYKP